MSFWYVYVVCILNMCCLIWYLLSLLYLYKKFIKVVSHIIHLDRCLVLCVVLQGKVVKGLQHLLLQAGTSSRGVAVAGQRRLWWEMKISSVDQYDLPCCHSMCL